jgi:hypothetical protein
MLQVVLSIKFEVTMELSFQNRSVQNLHVAALKDQ